MVYAFNPNSPNQLTFHENNYGFFDIILKSDGSCVKSEKFKKVSALHAWFMWSSWTLIATLQIITNRYLKHWWKWNQIFHGMLGFSSGVFTLTAALVMWNYQNKRINFGAQTHNFYAIISFPLCIAIVLYGIFIRTMRLFVQPWKTDRYIKLKRIHQYFGYFMIFGI